MTGLRGRMDYQIRRNLPDQRENRLPVANINVAVSKVGNGLRKSAQVPARITLRTKEIGAHIVVDADDLEPPATEIR